MKTIPKVFWFWLILISVMSHAEEAAEEWMPDANLRAAVREKLGLSNDVPLTKDNIKQLTHLEAQNREIRSIQGLEFAENLEVGLNLGGNLIQDITPLQSLTKLRGLVLLGNQVSDLSPLEPLTSLLYLNAAHNPISDLRVLSNLIHLEDLDLAACQISDVTPLAGLKNLKILILGSNLITDVSPLVNLTELEVLNIIDNPIWNFSALQHLNLTRFESNMFCKIPSLPVEERILTRLFPSIFKAWDSLIIAGLPKHGGIDYHDLAFSLTFGLNWHTTPSKSTRGLATQVAGNLEAAQDERDRLVALNPNIIFLRHIIIHGVSPSEFPPDSDFLLRDDKGEIVYSEIINAAMINLMNPKVQDHFIERIVNIAECGLYDGIMIDGFAWNATGFVGRDIFPHTDEEIIAATTRILREARNRARKNFLILINAGRSKPTAYAEYVDGSFMELGRNHPEGYTYRELIEIEDILLWNEENLRSPQINCLEGEGIGTEPPDSPENRRWMRLFTTMGLTHSDGYVLYNTGKRNHGGPDHEHIWYDFWDAPLGHPVGGAETKGQLYDNRDGVFIREYTNGWAVYNRSGKEQQIQLPEQTTGVASDTTDTQHTIPNSDGEIFLKTATSPADVNGDGTVNVLDLVVVANAFGKQQPDPNGDGVVNILDLVIIANAF
ncbi:MAG: leucine-rich repeat domain-containing protein [Candidatus Poribacteria bacterium]|nr:leucine-rich repeat domain-containing protein [Candidatus Poribacteria bacterium]